MIPGKACRLAEDVRIQSVEGPRDSLLAIRGSQYYYLSGKAKAFVLSLTQGGHTTRTEEDEQRLTEDQQIIRLLHERRLICVGSEDQGISEPASNQKRGWWREMFSSYLTFRVPVFPSNAVQRMAEILAPLFSTQLMACCTPLLMAFQLWFAIEHGRLLLKLLHHISVNELVLLAVGNYMCLLLHELGHASGAVKCGLPAGEIGLGAYLYMPAFYTNVTSAWSLPRFRRLIVDGGGIYMSLLLATLSSAFYLYAHNAVAGILAVAIDMTVLANLNPFIRMDGYWMLTDCMGVPNLMTINRRTSQWILNRILLRRAGRRPQIPEASNRLNCFYYVYYGAFILFSALTIVETFVYMVPYSATVCIARVHLILMSYKSHGLGLYLWKDVAFILIVGFPLITLSLMFLRKAVAGYFDLIKRETPFNADARI